MGAIMSSVCGGGGGGDTSEADVDSKSASVVGKYQSAESWKIHFDSVKYSNKLIVIDIAASWCSPCRSIEPAVNAMASKFSDVEFAKLDVDELPDVVKEWDVKAMPTFVLVKKGKEVDRIVGAKKGELEKKIKKHKS